MRCSPVALLHRKGKEDRCAEISGRRKHFLKLISESQETCMNFDFHSGVLIQVVLIRHFGDGPECE